MTAAAEHLAPVLDRALKEHVSATQVLEELLGIEVEATKARRQRGRLRFARYLVHKTLAEFDFDFQPGVDRRVVAELSTLRFVEEKRNVILLGWGRRRGSPRLNQPETQGTGGPERCYIVRTIRREHS